MANNDLTKLAKMVNYSCMELVDLRKQNGLTQKEAAAIIGIPYRTYIRYEENESYKESFKYRMMIEELNKKILIDEEHGVLTQAKIKETLIPILNEHDIKFCYLFGSYARNEARENSDVDLLIDTDITGMAFFKLIEEMRTALHKKVDLIRLRDITEDNPISLNILKEGIKIL